MKTPLPKDLSEKITATGGPAFPCTYSDFSFTGMSIRDWFAGQALMGLISANPTISFADPSGVERGFADAAYGLADAMLAARSLKQEGN